MTQSKEQKANYERGRSLLSRSDVDVTALGRMVYAFQQHGIDVGKVGNVRALWAKTKTIEDEDGEQKEVYAGSSVLLSPSWESGPEWQPVDQAKPVVIKVPPTPRKSADWRTAVILPDPQIGYRRLADGSLDPFHDMRAIDIGMQIVREERPDLVVWLGDVLDLASMSAKFRQEPGFAMTVQPAIEEAYRYMAITAAFASEVRFIEGNHDLRLQTYVVDNAMAAYGLKRAASPPKHWPVLSVPYLLRLNELGVQYISGYPNGATYINDNLACIHGRHIDLRKVADEEFVSVIQGHMHRIEEQRRTRNSRGRPRFTAAFSPGTLSRIDGAVPSTRSSSDVQGRPAKSWENWQQGLAVVRYEPGNGRFLYESIPIFEGWAGRTDGREYTSREILEP